MSYTETMLDYVYYVYCSFYNFEETLDFLEDEIDFSREQIKTMIQHTIDYKKDQFIKYYKSLVNDFDSKNNFSEIHCKNEKIVWPDKSGVYLIWKINSNSFNNLNYVGMTGKFNRSTDNKIEFNLGSFKKRSGRCSPYRFCESEKDEENQFTFRFGPKEKNVSKQSKIRFQKYAYKNTIPYSELLIHCFHISENHNDYTPELLEKEILTKYFKSSGNLPPANNEL